MLYRVFPFVPGAGAAEDGGPLHVVRALQGGGRHDNPQAYGALYASRSAQSAVAERIQRFRGRTLAEAHLRRADGTRYALAAIEDEGLDRPLVDLDDPRELVRRDLRPSWVATRDRTVTRPIALSIFAEGAAGLGWWSTLDAEWSNVTLFAERTRRRLRLAGDPEPLTLVMPALRAAARALGIRLAG